MFFLLRSAFWLTLVLALIPLGSEQSESTGESVDPVSAYFAASATVSDISGFCGRNPQACETGGDALAAIGTRARDGARIVYEFLDSQIATEQGEDVPTDETGRPLLTGSISNGTLTTQDLALPWKGTEADVSAPETNVLGPVPRPNPRLGSRT
jgi:hypothetical protein